MPDAYSYGSTDDQARPHRHPPHRPLRFLFLLLLLVGLAYLLAFSPWAPLADVGDRLRHAASDVTDGLLGRDATGTPDEILERWEQEFGAGYVAFKSAGPTATMLFKNNLRGLRNAVRREEEEKIERWRRGIEKNFETGRAWRAEKAAE